MDDLDQGATIKGFGSGQKVFGRYVLGSILGRGGMGVVWRARDEKLEREVALKFLPQEVKFDELSFDDLRREARRNLDLTHPNIVRVYDLVEDDRNAALAMEYVEGGTLAGLRLEQPQRHLTTGQLLPLLEQLAGALDYAHLTAKTVHRDIKPANILLHKGVAVKISDFGISSTLHDSMSRMSVKANSSGTLAYMSPQQAMGAIPSISDDIYALGSTLYELLTTRPPFHSGEVFYQLREIVPPIVSQRRAEFGLGVTDLDANWDAAIARCLDKDPARRPGTATEVLDLVKGRAKVAPVVAPTASMSSPPLPAKKDYSYHYDRREISMGWLTGFIKKLGPEKENDLAQLREAVVFKADYREGLELAQKRLDANPGDLDGRFYRGRCLLSLGKPAEAVPDFDFIVARQPQETKFTSWRAQCRRSLGDWPGALADLQTVRARNANEPSLHQLVADLQERAGNLAASLAAWNEVIKLRPKSAASWNSRGRIRTRLEDWHAAIEDFSQALHLRGQFKAALENRAIAFEKLGRNDEAQQDRAQLAEIS